MISLYDILQTSNGQLFGESSAELFTDFCVDPAKAVPNTLFVTLKTDQGDTHRYVQEVISKGVSGILCSRPPDCDTTGVSVILVRDTVHALMSWAQHILTRNNTKVIAVTGSSGKSVTAAAINRILSTRYSVYSADDDVPDDRLGVAIGLARLEVDHQFAILQLNPTQPGEMSAIVQTAQPRVGVVLTTDYTYTDRFQNIELLALEYRRLIETLPPGSLGVLNYDDDHVRSMGSSTRANIATIGVGSFGADLVALNVVIGLNGTGFDLRYGSERQIARWTPLLGKHHLYSILAALRVGLNYGISLDDGLRALSDMMPLAGRMNPMIGLNDCIVIDDSYDATPQSTVSALEWLKSVREPNQRVIFIMGDMDHLGIHAQTEHRQIGQLTADIADVFITEGMTSAAAGRAALDRGIDPHRIFTTYSAYDAVNALKERFGITSNDIVLVKGSASMRMERIVRILLKDPADSAKLVRQDFAENFNMTTQPMRPTWVEVDTSALASNVRAMKQFVGSNVTLMAVVKADGYGHGAIVASQTALLNGANYLAVANLQEALELREAAIHAPVLIMGYTPIYAVREAIRENITVTVYDLDLARGYDRAARDIGSRLRVHVKIDTGMGRVGVLPNEAMVLFRHLSTMQHLEIEGIYTHFSSADEDPVYTTEQLTTFRNVLRPLRGAGFNFKYIHAANSAAVLTNKDTHFNMVRCGISLYGLHPSDKVQLPSEFAPVMTWKTIVSQVKTLPPGHVVGYGNTYKTRREETVALLPIGYADGFSRTPNWKEVLIHGKRAPVIGRVSMEKTVVNVTDIPDVSIGDEVVLIGKQGNDIITVDEIAKRLGTINYDVVCNVLPRVPRR